MITLNSIEETCDLVEQQIALFRRDSKIAREKDVRLLSILEKDDYFNEYGGATPCKNPIFTCMSFFGAGAANNSVALPEGEPGTFVNGGSRSSFY